MKKYTDILESFNKEIELGTIELDMIKSIDLPNSEILSDLWNLSIYKYERGNDFIVQKIYLENAVGKNSNYLKKISESMKTDLLYIKQ